MFKIAALICSEINKLMTASKALVDASMRYARITFGSMAHTHTCMLHTGIPAGLYVRRMADILSRYAH